MVFRAGLVLLFEWVTMVMKLSLKFCSLCRSISSAHRTKRPFCTLSSSQGPRLSSLYLRLMVRELEWMLQTVENGKPTQTMWTQRVGALSITFTYKEGLLSSPLWNIFLWYSQTTAFPGHTSNQNKTALSKKLPFLRALPFHLPYFFLPLSLNFPCSSVGKESACTAGDPGLIPGSGGKWQPTPVFLSREFNGQRSMMGYIQSTGSQELDTTQWLNHHHHHFPCSRGFPHFSPYSFS